MTLRHRVLDTLHETVGNGKVFTLADTDSLLDNGLIDSLTMLDFAEALGRRFHIEVEDADLMPENLDSIEAIVGYLYRKGVSS